MVYGFVGALAFLGYDFAFDVVVGKIVVSNCGCLVCGTIIGYDDFEFFGRVGFDEVGDAVCDYWGFVMGGDYY